MATALLIGGTGFVGKSVLDCFAAGGLAAAGIDRLTVLSRHASALPAAFAACRLPTINFVDADLFDLESSLGADLLIHAAASSEASDYQAAPQAQQRLIVEGTRHLLAVALRQPRPPRFLYLSSGAVYGTQGADCPALAENAPLVDDLASEKAVYARAKRTAEALVSKAAHDQGLAAAIARCFAFVGPWLPRDRHFAIGNFIGAALRREAIVVKNPAPVYRSYMFADDLAVWLAMIGQAANPACPIYNVGSDEAIALTALAKRVGDLLGAPVQLPVSAITEPVDRYVPDTARARRELGLTLRWGLDAAIVETVRRIRDGDSTMETAS